MKRIKESLICCGLVVIIIAMILAMGKTILETEKSMVTSRKTEIHSILAELNELN